MDRYEDIAEEHAGQAAFLWHLRSLAVAQPHYLLDDLEALDSRLAAHVDGLREASTAWDACRRLLADGTPWPMTVIACGCGVLSLIVGAIPFVQKRLRITP